MGGGLYYQFDECSQYGGYYRWGGDCITSLTSVASMGGITGGGGGLYYQFD